MFENIFDSYSEKELRRSRFLESKGYYLMINNIFDEVSVRGNIDSDDPEDVWTNEVDIMFDFLFYNAGKILPFEEEAFIEYKGNFICLYEMHGQGTLRGIQRVQTRPRKFAEFKDIVRYHEFGKRPFKSYVIETINRSLSALRGALDSDYIAIGEEKIEIERVREYIEDLICEKSNCS